MSDDEELELVELESGNDPLYHFHIDEKNRRVYLYGEITNNSVLLATKNLSVLDDTEGEIFLIINSVGGSIIDGWGLIDHIRSLQNTVIGVVMGEAASMASSILQACDIRRMTKNSLLLIHRGEMVIHGQASAAATHAKMITEEQNRTIELFMSRCHISKKRLNLFFSDETIFNAKESLKYGLIDEVI